MNDLDPLRCYRHVRQTLEQVPHAGIGYGLLRYLHPDHSIRDTLEQAPRPDLFLTYTGRLHQPQRSQQLLPVLDTSVRHNHRSPNQDAIQIGTACFAGLRKGRIGWRLKYDPRGSDEQAIQAVSQGMAQFLEQLLASPSSDA